jgi:hypothetical protein
VAQGRDVLRFSIDWSASTAALADAKQRALAPPDPLDDHTHLLTSDAVEAGYDLLYAALSSYEPMP